VFTASTLIIITKDKRKEAISESVAIIKPERKKYKKFFSVVSAFSLVESKSAKTKSVKIRGQKIMIKIPNNPRRQITQTQTAIFTTSTLIIIAKDKRKEAISESVATINPKGKNTKSFSPWSLRSL
jgi:hypothetical protein